jgi:hypothetical protein
MTPEQEAKVRLAAESLKDTIEDELLTVLKKGYELNLNRVILLDSEAHNLPQAVPYIPENIMKSWQPDPRVTTPPVCEAGGSD